jgi:hypothetical protein
LIRRVEDIACIYRLCFHDRGSRWWLLREHMMGWRNGRHVDGMGTILRGRSRLSWGLGRGALELGDVRGDDLVLPFLKPRSERKRWANCTLLTAWSSARTSSLTPYSSNSGFIFEMTSSMTAL